MIKFAVNRPVTIIMISLGLIALGLISAQKIHLKLLPTLVTPEFTVVTKYKGATAEEVEEKITIPIEKALSTEGGLYRMESYSVKERSSVLLKFSSRIKVLETLTNLREKLDGLSFDKGVSRPKILRFNPNAEPIMRVSFSSQQKGVAGLYKLSKFLNDTLKKRLESLDGVALAQILGGPEKKVFVRFDPIKTQFFGVDPTQLGDKIKKNNQDLSSGEILENGKNLPIRLAQKISTLEDLRKIPIKGEEKGQARIKDIATVSLNFEDTENKVHLNGEKGLLLEIKKESEANTVLLVKEVNKVLKKFLKENPDIEGRVLLDQGEKIQSSIDNVIGAVINGGILAAVVIFIFLQSMGPTIIVSLSIPMSLFITLILMYFTGVSFNLMSLGGLALGVGMLVDNSIVVLENINRFKSKVDDINEAVYWGTKKVASAITSSTMTTIAVFGPLVFVEGMVGQLFKDISLTVVYSLSSSLFVALILIPCLSSLKFSDREEKTSSKLLDQILKDLERLNRDKAYEPWWKLPISVIRFNLVSIQTFFVFVISNIGHGSLSLLMGVFSLVSKVLRKIWSPFKNTINQTDHNLKIFYGKKMGHMLLKKGKTVWITLFFFFGSLGYLYFQGAELFPSDAEGQWTYELELPSGTLVENNEKIIYEIESKLKSFSEVKMTTSLIGKGGPHLSELDIYFDPMGPQVLRALERNVRNILKKIPELKFVKKTKSLVSSAKPVEVEIYHHDDKALYVAGATALKAMREIKGLKNIESSIKGKLPEFELAFEPLKLGIYQKSMSDFTDLIKTIILGKSGGVINIEGNDYPIVIQGQDNYFNNLEKLLYFPHLKDEKQVYLSQVSRLKQSLKQAQIKHIDRKKVVTISSDIDQIDLKTASILIDKKLSDRLTDKFLKWKLGGQDQERKEGEKSLFFAIGLSIFLIYILLASQFESFAQPGIILFSVPLCMIGVSVSLFATGVSLSALVLIGLIILAGISVNNSIVLVDSMNERILGGMEKRTAIVEAAKNRIRPILMTTFSTVVGLLPMALGLGEGASMRRPLAITVIGGLISSTFFTLLIVPLVYDLISRKTKINEN